MCAISIHVTFTPPSFSLQQVKKLQAILKPMMLRRLKDDVEKNLAPKEETIIEVEFYKNKQSHKLSDFQQSHICTVSLFK